MMLKDMRFRYKMNLMPLIATIGFMIIGFTSYLAGSRLQSVFNEIQTGHSVALELYRDLAVNLENLKRGFTDAVAAADPEELAKPEAVLDSCLTKLQEAEDRPTMDNAQLQSLAQELNKYYALASETSILMINQEWREEVQQTIGEMQAQYKKVTKLIESLIEQERIDFAESFERAERIHSAITKTAVGVSLVCLVALVAISFIFTRYLTHSLRSTTEIANNMAKGDLSQRLTDARNDELGKASRALDRVFVMIREVIETIGSNSLTLASSAEELSSLSQEMSSTAEETSSQARFVTNSAEQVNLNIQNVAVAIEQLTSSVKEIAANAYEAAAIASSAVDVATETNRTISTLGTSSEEIGNVINVITSIAEQTNLLALNATIEAARAGEAGKGFGVVANEVKELAKETAKATEDIRQKIGAIQTDSVKSVEAINQIGSIIEQINTIQTSIATAVEEQTATTSEIGRNISEAARGSSEIAGNIAGVAEAAEGTSAGATSTLAAASELAEMAAALRSTVSHFRF
jgi:methyl-accepting chemotaxis protein